MRRYFYIAFPIIALVVIYIFQHFSFALLFNSALPESLEITNQNTVFIVNKTTRLILNDLFCMWLISLLFQDRIYLTGALILFAIELLILLPIYFVLKLNLEGTSELSSPLLSQLHRLIVNPLLMFLLMVGFVYQRLKTKK